MAIEFAFGFGFGKRIIQIDRIETDGALQKLQGSIQIWWEDVSTFQLVLDDHHLVREARIEANVKGNHIAFEVTTTGMAVAENLNLPKTARLKKLGSKVDGKMMSKGANY